MSISIIYIYIYIYIYTYVYTHRKQLFEHRTVLGFFCLGKKISPLPLVWIIPLSFLGVTIGFTEGLHVYLTRYHANHHEKLFESTRSLDYDKSYTY